MLLKTYDITVQKLEISREIHRVLARNLKEAKERILAMEDFPNVMQDFPPEEVRLRIVAANRVEG